MSGTHAAGYGSERLARAALTRLAEPGDAELGAALASRGAVEVYDAVCGRAASDVLPAGLFGRLRLRLGERSPEADLAAAARVGGRLVCPEDGEWPAAFDVLGAEQPLALWVRGELALDAVFARAVAVVGARAATSYGTHVASELSFDLAGRGWTVVSGGAYGIDGAAHRGALAAGGITVAVLACGVDVAYPRGHDQLLDRIAREGLVMSEWPPGCAPRPKRFLVRNRVIAAATAGTVVVEAALRSGAVSTGRRAETYGRMLMAVPGPVTSAMSAGCHLLLRDHFARAVSNAAEVVEEVGRIGADLAPRAVGEERSRDLLDEPARCVLEAVPVRRAQGPSRIASRAGVDVVTVRRCLSLLAGEGFVEDGPDGYRLSAAERVQVEVRRRRQLTVPQPDADPAATSQQLPVTGLSDAVDGAPGEGP